MSVWYALKGNVDKVHVAEGSDVADLRDAIREKNPSLQSIDPGRITIKTSPEGEALDPGYAVAQIDGGKSSKTPLYVDFPEVEEPAPKRARTEDHEVMAMKEAMKVAMRELRSEDDRRSSMTPGEKADECRRLAQSRTLEDGPEEEAFISPMHLQRLNSARDESELIALMTTHLQRIDPERDVVNSERLKWDSNMSPDLFLCMPGCYKPASRVPEYDDHVKTARAREELESECQHKFGTPHPELEDSVAVLEAKLQSQPRHLAQLRNYLDRMVDGDSSGMLFDKKGFTLLNMHGKSQHKLPTRIVEGSWKARDAGRTIREFLRSSDWGRFACDAASHGLQLKRFLGAGRTGRVFCVEKAGQLFAMKVVGLADIGSAKKELALLRSAHAKGAPVAEPVSESVQELQRGGFFLLRPVGQEVDRALAITRLEQTVGCLQALHSRSFTHGDARLRNLIVDDTGKMLWIDMRESSDDALPQRKVSDIQSLLRSLQVEGDLLLRVTADSLGEEDFMSALRKQLAVDGN